MMEALLLLTISSMLMLPISFMGIVGLTYLVQHLIWWIDDCEGAVRNNAFLSLVGRIHGYTREVYCTQYKGATKTVDNDDMLFSWILKLMGTGFVLPMMWCFPLVGMGMCAIMAVPFLLRALARFNKKLKKLEDKEDAMD